MSMDIQLRNDVTFHTGRKMTSADVVYTIQQVQNPANTVESGHAWGKTVLAV